MKRLTLIIIAGFFVVFNFSSCKKCYTCTFSAGRVETLCPKDFPEGNKDLKLSVKAYQDQGYTCIEN